MSRPWNFSAGPSALPEAVLTQAAAEMLDWHGSGMSVMEMSHRGREFTQICDEAEADLRELLGVSGDYAVMFMQGGATAENAIIPMNLMGRVEPAAADFVLTGHWSRRSHKEAAKYGSVSIAASSEAEREIDGGRYQSWAWAPPVNEWKVRQQAAYVHLCSNETIGGVELADWPVPAEYGAPDVPLIVDASSHFLSRPMDVVRTGMVYAGAQKNAGPAGLTMVIVRRDLLGKAMAICPTAFDYSIVAAERSRYNTPPTYAIYIAGLVFKWIKAQGGLAGMAARNVEKAGALYAYLDSTEFYANPIHAPVRSRMNVPFLLRDESLNDAFLAGAAASGLMQLKGHKSVGGMRASIYNALPLAGVQALVAYMTEFERRHG